jgi:hypothetical protein
MWIHGASWTLGSVVMPVKQDGRRQQVKARADPERLSAQLMDDDQNPVGAHQESK